MNEVARYVQLAYPDATDEQIKKVVDLCELEERDNAKIERACNLVINYDG